MSAEAILIVLVIIVLVMAEVLHWLKKSRPAARSAARRKPGHSAGHPGMNYGLAPKNPDIMAAALFDLLSRALNYDQLLAFSDLVADPGLTAQYVERLVERGVNPTLTGNLAFLAESMEANGFSAEARRAVSLVLRRKTENEYKLLKIHKNLDKIL